MDIDLAAATSAMDQIRAKFDSVEEDGKRAVGEAKAEAKRQRQVLVNAALSSLNSLRTHLVATLTGLREDAAPAQKQMATQVATDDDGAKLAWNAAQGRWALMSGGRWITWSSESPCRRPWASVDSIHPCMIFLAHQTLSFRRICVGRR